MTDASPSSPSHQRWWPSAWLCLILPLILIGPSLLPGRVALPVDLVAWVGLWKADPDRPVAVSNPMLHDVIIQFVPWNLEARRHLARGELPWVDRFAGGGAPLFANPQSGLLSPVELPRLIAPLRGWGFVFFLRCLLAGLGAFWLARELGATIPEARISSFVYPLCGHAVVWLCHPLATVTAWLPWLAAAMLRLSKVPSRRGVLITGALAALATAGGHPESLMMGMFAIFALLLFQYRRDEAPAWPYALAAAAAGFLLLAVQTLPFLSVLADSEAFQGRTAAAPGGLRWPAIAAQFLPGFLGWPLAGEVDVSRLVGPETVLLRTGGFLGASLFVLLWLERRRLNEIQQFALGVAGVALLTAWRPPGIEWLLHNIPLVGHSLPSYRLVGFVLLGSALAGPVICRCRRRPWLGWLLIVAGSLLVLFGTLPLMPALATKAGTAGITMLHGRGLLPSPIEVYEARLPAYLDAAVVTALKRLALPGLCWIVAGLGLLWRRPWRVRILTAAIVGELLVFAWGWVPSLPLASTLPPSEHLVKIQELDPDHEFQLVAGPGVFLPNLGTLYQVRDYRSYTVLESAERFARWRSLGYRTSGRYFDSQLDAPQLEGLAQDGVRFFLSRQPVAGSRPQIGGPPPAVALYELAGARPSPLPVNRPPPLLGVGLAISLGAGLVLLWLSRRLPG